jgi:hypothetical protein
VFIVALAIAPGHGFTQGFVLPTLLWYFAADVMFGFLSLLVGSILPGIVVHTVGLLIFFSVIWPTDRYRHAAGLARQAPSFWIELLACVVFGALSVLAFLRLAATVQSHSELKGQAGGSSPGPQPGVR